MQLSWAGKHAEAARVLERQIAISEADATSLAWPTVGRLQFTAYAPLSIVYRWVLRPSAQPSASAYA